MTLEREVQIAAPPQTVYEHFVDPASMCRWMGVEAELEPHPGGLFRVNVDGRNVARGEYVELVPHEKVVFTWGWENEEHSLDPGDSTVEVTLAARDGGTRLRLVHSGIGSEESAAAHARGWDHYLDRLAAAPAGGAGADPWVRATA